MINNKRQHTAVFTALLLAIFAGTAQADPIKVLFLGHENDVAQDNAVRIDILGTDTRFDHAGSSSWDAVLMGLPPLALLGQYDSVLLWTNFSPTNPDMGDLMADYVDAGGGVVLATFWGQASAEAGAGLSGRINAPGYNPFTNPQEDAYSSAVLGSYDSLDPLFQGVSSLSASQYRGDYLPGLDTGATLAGSWDDGNPLAGYNLAANVINITLYPNVVQSGHASGDYQQLFRNGLALAADAPEPAPIPEPSSLILLGSGLAALVRRLRRARG